MDGRCAPQVRRVSLGGGPIFKERYLPSLKAPLRRSRSDRMIAGVVAGLARYFDLDPTLARVLYVVVSILSAAFPGILVYIALWIIIPEGD